MYKVSYHPRVKKDLKKLDRPVVKEIQEVHIPKILQNPKESKALVKNLAGIFSYHFRYEKQSYRIAYLIDESQEVVAILLIGKREGFYDVLRRRQ